MPLWKRIVDVGFSLAAMPLLGVCILLVAILHRFVSPGPLFFMQDRVGYRGRIFRIWKFRTMDAGTDTKAHQDHFRRLMATNAPMVKLDLQGDARLIRGARLMRASGLDELPQLLNVLRGDMSLVGPRPCIPSEYEGYLPSQRLRTNATPGLTGLWQVSGKNRTTFEEMIRLDILYSATLSPARDLWILLMTLPAVCGQVRDARKAKAREIAATPEFGAQSALESAPVRQPTVGI